LKLNESRAPSGCIGLGTRRAGGAGVVPQGRRGGGRPASHIQPRDRAAPILGPPNPFWVQPGGFAGRTGAIEEDGNLNPPGLSCAPPSARPLSPTRPLQLVLEAPPPSLSPSSPPADGPGPYRANPKLSITRIGSRCGAAGPRAAAGPGCTLAAAALTHPPPPPSPCARAVLFRNVKRRRRHSSPHRLPRCAAASGKRGGQPHAATLPLSETQT
jgi:hypothetical protein